ncbi:MAG TPA: F0F1 ATP synthase subunit A [Chloroflexota bacterium]|nr:F0F1 ATP synthase subunit A [Chloroflexota bacterium]
MGRNLRIILIVAFLAGATIVGFLFFRVKTVPHIQLPAEIVAFVGGFPITNTMVAAWLTIILLLVLFRLVTANLQMVPGRAQNLAEVLIEGAVGLAESVAGRERARIFFPLVMTIFLFVLTSNWMGLLPGYHTIYIQSPDDHHHGEMVPLIRSANTDLNMTLALALVAVVGATYFGIRQLGIGEYAGKFFNFREGVIGFFIGILELISEFSRILSFAFRLFGNIFAGEVLLAVVGFLIPWIVILPFFGLELFVGFIQAFVFAMLTLVFMTVATTSHAHHESHEEGHH